MSGGSTGKVPHLFGDVRPVQGKESPCDEVKIYRSVADRQDKVGKGETALPVREMLADMLLEMQHPQEALAQLLKNCDGVRSDRPELSQAKTLIAAK